MILEHFERSLIRISQNHASLDEGTDVGDRGSDRDRGSDMGYDQCLDLHDLHVFEQLNSHLDDEFD